MFNLQTASINIREINSQLPLWQYFPPNPEGHLHFQVEGTLHRFYTLDNSLLKSMCKSCEFWPIQYIKFDTHTFHSNPLQSKYLEISPYWQVSPSYPLEQKQLLFRMQIPACLQGGSHVALGSKTKGRATPRGPSDPPRQIPARVASATSKSCMDVQQSTAIFISTLLQGSRSTESAGECMFGQHTALWSSTGQTWYCRGPQLEKY